jgi:predicted CXXCH cytochrome family protein
MLVEWLVIIFLLAGAGYLVFGKGAFARFRGIAFAFLAAAVLGVWLWQMRLEAKVNSRASLTIPRVGRPEEYAGSDSCRACHPDQYSSWHHSFHRTMTQIASPESIRGNFNDVNLTLDGESYHLQRRGDEFWVDMVDPDWKLSRQAAAKGRPAGSAPEPEPAGATAPRVQRRVSMVTGSHHMQAYWVDNGHGNQQFSLPFTYLFEQERWVPRRCVFIKDPKLLPWAQVWNVGCVDCHSTAGQPWQAEDKVSFNTRVAEFGIACESCHGPAAEHIRRNSNPLRRYALHFENKGDPSIVNPSRLSSKRSSEVCGRCHSVHGPLNQDEWLQHGETVRPGDDLEEKLTIVRQRPSELRPKTCWNDGMIRVSGRDYNGLIESPCYLKGEMSCASCHSMHESSPTNQLARQMDGNFACLQCHQSFAKNLTEHTHHAAGSTGSLCYNCHMPYTTYGLLKAVRSHQISSPSVTASVRTGRPNACNLCHLDKTLDWTAQNLSAWYKTPGPELSEENKSVAASILWALEGDAGQRALIAWHMGWQPAKEASHSSWLALYLATLLEDPYPVVRYIAGRSLTRLPGFENFSYDSTSTDAEDLRRSRQNALRIWKQTAKLDGNPALLLETNGVVHQDALEALLKSRNNRIVELNE